MHPLSLSSDLVARGFSHGEIARLTRTGQLRRIRPGAYVDGESAAVEPRERHHQLVAATVPQVAPDSVVSHVSASALHELPVWDSELSRVHLTRDLPTGAKLRRHVQVHNASLAPDEITLVDGRRVTSLARTVVDVGRTQSLRRAVATGDAALARGLTSEVLREAVARARGRTGVGAARRMAALCDPRSESVGESFSRVVFADAGLPAPTPQFEVHDEQLLIGRCDFGWEELRTLGEFDGKVTYGRLLKDGESAGDVIYAEKLREDCLRDLGWEVVRWSWWDLYHPDAPLERLNRAFVRGRRRS